MKFIFNFILLFFVISMPFKVFAQEEILLGLIPEQNIFKQMERYRPLASYLSEKAGVKVRLTILSRYGDIVERFVARSLDGAFFDSLTGAMAITRMGVEPMARPVNLDGKATVRSYIFVRTDSKINSVKDMKGKKVVFVDMATATGYLFAVAFLHENGIHDINRYFNEYFFTGSHDSAIYSVLDNRADIGSAQDTIFNMLASKDPTIKRELHIIAQSEELPETTLCLRKSISSKIKNRITDILLHMNEDPAGKKILKKFGAVKFIRAEAGDFNSVFNLARRAQINIKEYKGTR
ncbi:MAG: phosphate/phosphite/phosphonate ABC transporter substrate-binding protein [Thermodesulfovibrionales bacterium]|nr:phosphate/phosphite/phosphonate ABC transporter substrate-binding protein [Thermodesulfovibrionales bacterium]